MGDLKSELAKLHWGEPDVAFDTALALYFNYGGTIRRAREILEKRAKEMAERGQSPLVGNDQTARADLRQPSPGPESHCSRGDHPGPAFSAREPSLETGGRCHVAAQNGDAPSSPEPIPDREGQGFGEAQTITAPAAQEPIQIAGGGGQLPDEARSMIAPVVQQPSPGGVGHTFIETHRESAHPVREPLASEEANAAVPAKANAHLPPARVPPATRKLPNKARDFAAMDAAYRRADRIYELKLNGRMILHHTWGSIKTAHASLAREFKKNITQSAESFFEFAVTDQMMKCGSGGQIDDAMPADQLFSPAQLKQFDGNAREMIQKTAKTVADNAFAFMASKTGGISDART